MEASRLSVIARICCCCFLVFTLSNATLFGQEWQEDANSAPDAYGCGDVSFECGDELCGCYSTSNADCGYCLNGPFLTDELTARFMSAAESMEARGITYAPVPTQFYQGVASGGREQVFDYGGKLDQFLILDSDKLGLWQGMTMTMHAETRFGQDVNLDAVGFAPVNVAMLYPKFNEHDTAITGLTFAQAINDETQLTFGKFNALDLFYSLYPQTGRGVNGFMNASMVIPISVARVVPLSFLGAGALQYHEKQVQGGLLVYDTHNIPTTSGFDELFDNGANILGFWRFFTDVGGLPGSHLFGGIWSTGEFVSFDPTGFAIIPDDGLVVPRQSGAYTLIYVFEQTLWADCCNKNRNVALLSQWGLADERTSPFSWSANVGLQATGISCSRPHDALGVGFFYTGLSDDFQSLLSPLRDLDDVYGAELYYTAAVSKCFQLTADLQVIEPADESNDTAIVFGLRGTVGL
jgi:porin